MLMGGQLCDNIRIHRYPDNNSDSQFPSSQQSSCVVLCRMTDPTSVLVTSGQVRVGASLVTSHRHLSRSQEMLAVVIDDHAGVQTLSFNVQLIFSPEYNSYYYPFRKTILCLIIVWELFSSGQLNAIEMHFPHSNQTNTFSSTKCSQ